MRALLVALCLLVPLPLWAQAGQPLVCRVVNTSTTTLVAFVGTGCVGNEAQTAFFITDISASSSVISSTAADDALELKYGTGTNCGTGTTLLWASYSLALTPVTVRFQTPMKVPGGKDLCWMHAGTGSKTFIVSGYLGPQ